jgi:hypothetical protein
MSMKAKGGQTDVISRFHGGLLIGGKLFPFDVVGQADSVECSAQGRPSKTDVSLKNERF